MKLGVQVGLGPGHIVLGGDPTLPPQRGTAPPNFGPYLFRPNGCIWIKMPLGMEEGLGPGDFVLDVDPASSPKKGGAPSPSFGPFLLWPNSWMHQDTTSVHVYCAKRLDGRRRHLVRK